MLDGAQLRDGLGNHMHIHRTAAIKTIHDALEASPERVGEIVDLVGKLSLELCVDERWEARVGGFAAAQAIIAAAPSEYRQQMAELCKECLEHSENRVRVEVGRTMGALCRVEGAAAYVQFADVLLKSIADNFEREAVDASALHEKAHHNHEHNEDHHHHHHANEDEQRLEDEMVRSGKLKHDTAGWQCLETSVTALCECVKGTGEAFAPHVTPALLSRLRVCCDHINRFVRETAFFCYAALSETCNAADIEGFADEMVDALSAGLADNWSQVRFSASTAARAFVLKVPQLREKYFGVLVPRLCLNRHYVAEGVKLYSVETWKMVMGTEGKAVLGQYIAEASAFYVSQAQADNHAVREAACHCIAEVAVCLPKERVGPHVEALLQALVDAFKDESWPVRDAACLASGEFVKAFPEESRVGLQELYELWFSHLSDNIKSVREDSALALKHATVAYPQECVAKVREWLTAHLLEVAKQPAESYSHGELSNVTLFGVAAKKARDNDEDLHTNQQTFSCGSLAPKLKRGGGCMDHGFARPRQPWEYTDGALNLMRALVSLEEGKACVKEFVGQLEEVAQVRHFAHHVYLQESLWKAVAVIAKALGLNGFYNHLATLVPQAVKTLQCGHQLAEASAADALTVLQRMYGKEELFAVLAPSEADVIKNCPLMKPKRGR